METLFTFSSKIRTQLGFLFVFVNILTCLLLFRNDYFSSIFGYISRTENVCLGRYIYIHDLPRQFNDELLQNCHSRSRKKNDKFDLCMHKLNSGFGPQIENSNGVFSNTSSWFNTNQFLLEVIFHNRMKKYECLTNDSSLASAIFVPFYAGIELRRHLWGYKPSERDSSGINLVKWLAEKPEWKKMWGMDHFLVSGRISKDFKRRSNNKAEWGSNFKFLPESQNMSMLSIESSSRYNELAIPYPTYFHPSQDSEVYEWQDRMRRQKRKHLFSFVGAPRGKSRTDNIRGNIIGQCQDSSSSCKLLDCTANSNNFCENTTKVMMVFERSVFCLQPRGDSLTRRSIFDSILAGCIPVLFHPGSAYTQYKWHLPENHTKYSIFIPEKKLLDRRFRINETLVGVSKVEEEAMREEVIKLIPRIIYADPKSKLKTIEDAFDLAVKGILERIHILRRKISKGKIPQLDLVT